MEKLKEKITIGRSPKNKVQIQNGTVSGAHCTIERIAQNSFLLIDAHSTNGTKVNDRRIRRKIISIEDKIELGSFRLQLDKIYPAAAPTSSPVEAVDHKEKFRALKEVWAQYQQARAHIVSKDSSNKTWIRAAAALVPFVGNAIGIALTAHIDSNEKLQALRNEFMIAYLCPKCNGFLGELPYESLEKQGHCKYCKVQWADAPA